MSRLCGQEEEVEWTRRARVRSEACLFKGDGLTGGVERVCKCLSILERGHGRQF